MVKYFIAIRTIRRNEQTSFEPVQVRVEGGQPVPSGPYE